MGSRGGNVFGSHRRRHVGRWIALGVLLAVIACAIYTVFDNGRVVIRQQRVLVASLPQALEGFTVLHISDLNGYSFGPGQKQLVNALKGKRYNAVCLTGDMVGARGDAHPFYELLSALDPTKPVYFITGDSDPLAIGAQSDSNTHSVVAEWVLGAQTRNAVFLGAPASLQVGGATVWFTDANQLPLDLDVAETAYASSSSATNLYMADVVRETKTARSQMKDDDLHIALSHKPVNTSLLQTMLSVTDENDRSFVRTVDLVLAGGTVGGQWRLPFVGPVWSDGWFPGNDALVSGYQYAGSLLQYISGGLGTSSSNPLPGFRLFNSPEMSLITFTSQMDVDVLP